MELHPKIAQNPVQWTPAMSQAADRETRLYNERMRRGRRLPPVLAEVSKISDMQQVHVFNVGPWADKVLMGSWGSVAIPACPKDKKYIHVHTFPGIYNEPQPAEDKFTIDQVSGSYMAQCLLGEGPDLRNVPMSESRKKYGVFIGSVVGPEGVVPQDWEIEAALAALDAELDDLIAVANRAWEIGGKEPDLVIGSKNRLAATIKGRTDVKWMNKQTTQRQIPCINCGEQRNPIYPTCPHCKTVVDRELYDSTFGATSANKPTVAPPLSPNQSKRG
tara:strand:- start:1393 stop:2217 length:825 start_codon:yes stop_codon:yes gene_type:complete